jgi:hypothetical protein
MNRMMPSMNTSRLTARQIGLTMGAEVAGMPVHGDVSPDLLSDFVSMLHRYRILVMPELDLDPADLVAFSRNFGPWKSTAALKTRYHRTGIFFVSAMSSATA